MRPKIFVAVGSLAKLEATGEDVAAVISTDCTASAAMVAYAPAEQVVLLLAALHDAVAEARYNGNYQAEARWQKVITTYLESK